MITKKNIAKLMAALVLTLTVITSSGIVAEQVGVDVVPNVYACGGANGGGC